jgi:hypothetical protein
LLLLLSQLLWVEWGTAVLMKMGEMGRTESVGWGDKQISSPVRVRGRISLTGTTLLGMKG